MEAGRGGGRLHIGLRVNEAHRRSERESVAFASLDGKCDEAVSRERGRDGNDDRGEVADIDEGVGGDDKIKSRRGVA
jgi:hypothetical protein